MVGSGEDSQEPGHLVADHHRQCGHGPVRVGGGLAGLHRAKLVAQPSGHLRTKEEVEEEIDGAILRATAELFATSLSLHPYSKGTKSKWKDRLIEAYQTSEVCLFRGSENC